MVLVPVIGIIVIICWFAFFTYGLLWVMSCGKIVMKSDGLLTYYVYEWTDEQKYMMWYTAFLFFWITAFIVACTQYILIVAVVSWYFTENANNRGNFSLLRGYWWSLRYNLGSLLFGSFIIAVIWMIRVIFEYINRKITQSNGGAMAPPMQAFMKCCRCALDCCHRFVKYVNMHAYC